MKKIICILLIGFLLAVGCKKDNSIPPDLTLHVTLPYKSDNIKLELVTSSAPSNIRDIFFFNASTGICVSYEGKIYKTVNSGVTWNLQYSNPTPDQPLFQILFTDTNIGYVVGGSNDCGGTGCVPPGGLILKTTDSGNTWTSVFQIPGVELVSISTNSLGDLFVISNGTKGRIFKSTNAGLNWTAIDSPDLHFEEIFFSDNFGFCTAIKGKIIRSSDNGITWTLTTSLNANYATDIKFNSGNGYCIADNQTVYKTTDNGSNWIQNLNSDFSLLVLNPLTINSCLVFGAGRYTGGDFGTWYGAVRQTTNSGKDWTETEFTDIEPIRYTSFYSATEGYAVARSKLIKITVK